MLAVPNTDAILGLDRDTVLIFGVTGAIVALQVLVSLVRPTLDRLLYRADRDEVNQIQQLEDHLWTTSDLEQLLENMLLSLCELLRTPSGFVVTMHDGEMAVRVTCGDPPAIPSFLDQATLPTILQQLAASRVDQFLTNEDFVRADGHWLVPLKSRTDGSPLGIIGIRGADLQPAFTDADLEAAYGLITRAELALEDMRLQKRIFGLLSGIDQDLSGIQGWRMSTGHAAELAAPAASTFDPNRSPGQVQAVKDALAQFWGGPKLSKSPLIHLRVVTERLAENDDVPARAIRSVLQEAIERQKPNGVRSLTSAEWTVYNILEMRFVQGMRTRDIAARLAMSESDYYRKQRVAIEEVADTLAQMEHARARRSEPPPEASA